MPDKTNAPKTLALRRKMPNSLSSAPILAANICHGLMESGESMRKSRRSGNIISHSKMATAPMTTNE